MKYSWRHRPLLYGWKSTVSPANTVCVTALPVPCKSFTTTFSCLILYTVSKKYETHGQLTGADEYSSQRFNESSCIGRLFFGCPETLEH